MKGRFSSHNEAVNAFATNRGLGAPFMTGTQSGPGSRARRYRELLLHAGSFALTLAIIGTGLLWALPSVSVGYSACSFGAVWSISVALSLNVVYHFWLTAWSDPGRIPTLSRTTWAKLVPLAAKPSHIESLLPWCDKCDNLKPMRAHHCSRRR